MKLARRRNVAVLIPIRVHSVADHSVTILIAWRLVEKANLVKGEKVIP